jgi:hypothetical protein
VERIPAGTGSGFVWDRQGEVGGCASVTCVCHLREGNLLAGHT